MSGIEGVPVWRVKHEGFPPIVQPESWTGSQENADSYARAVSKVGVSHEVIVGRWHPEPVAVALVAVAEAARELRDFYGRQDSPELDEKICGPGLLAALDALAEAQAS